MKSQASREMSESGTPIPVAVKEALIREARRQRTLHLGDALAAPFIAAARRLAAALGAMARLPLYLAHTIRRASAR
jgi:hypothetical protein